MLHLPGASEVGRADMYCAMTLMLIRPPGAAPCRRSGVPGASRLHAGPQTPHQLPPQVLFFLFFSSSSNYFFLSFLPRMGENRSAAVIGFKNLINSAAILVGIRKVRIGVSTITERAGEERAGRILFFVPVWTSSTDKTCPRKALYMRCNEPILINLIYLYF